MTIPKGFISTGQAAELLGFGDSVYGRQYMSQCFRWSDNAPKKYGKQNANMHYKKTDVERWVRDNDAKQALKYARQMAQGKVMPKIIDDVQQMRLDFITGKLGQHKHYRALTS